MPKSNRAIITQTAGEWSPDLDARQDLEKAGSASRTLRNMIIDRYGGVFRRPGLKFISEVKAFSAIDYVSYEGSGILYGITEFGDLSDPPKKYRNMNGNLVGLNRKEAGNGSGSTIAAIRLTTNEIHRYNDGGGKDKELGVNVWNGVAGSDWSLLGSPPAGTPKQIGQDLSGSAGGFNLDTLEEYQYPSSHALFGFLWDTWTKGKRKKSHPLNTIQKPSLEDANSPFFGWISDQLGSSTSSNARTHVRLYAVRGTDVWTVYVAYQMGEPAVGSGPATSLFLSLVGGDNPVAADTDETYLTGGASFAGGPLYAYRRFALPPDTSFRLRMNIAGETTELMPNDWTLSTAYPIADDDIVEAGGRNWFYLPDVSTGVEGDDEYAEFLTFEDEPIAFLSGSGASGVVVGTDEWAQTSVFSGGVTAESHASISYTMRNVESAYTLSGLTLGYTYPVTLTYQERDIGGANPNSLQEVVNVVATNSSGVEEFTQVVVAQVGRERKLVNASKGTGVAPVVPPTSLEGETILWKGAVTENGGTYVQADVDALDALHAELKTISVSGRLDECGYLMPLCGQDLLAAEVPSVDIRQFGIGTNLNGNLTDSDFDAGIGLSGTTWVSDAAAKMYIMPFKLTELGVSQFKYGLTYTLTNKPSTGINNSAMGMWASPTNHAGFIGWNESLARLSLHSGNTANGINVTSQSEAVGDTFAGMRYGNTSRVLYKNGVSIGTNTTNDSGIELADYVTGAFGRNQPPLGNVYDPMPTGYSIGIMMFDFGAFGTNATKQLAIHNAFTTYLTALGRL